MIFGCEKRKLEKLRKAGILGAAKVGAALIEHSMHERLLVKKV